MWSFVLCELGTASGDGRVIGRIENAYERRVTLGINGLGTASLTLRLDNPRAKDITDREADCMVKVYQDSTLRLVAECVTAEEIWDADRSVPTLACTFANPMWKLSKRFVGTSATGEGFTVTADRAAILGALITGTNSGTGADTGIVNGTVSGLRSQAVGPWRFKPVAEAFSDLAASFAPPAFETVTITTSADTFAGTPSSALAGRTSTSGHTWNTAGAATDWTIDAGGTYLSRVVGSDGASDGRKGILGTFHATPEVLVQSVIGRGGTLGSPTTLQGIIARYVDANNYLRLTVTTDAAGLQVYRLTKMISGTATDIWTSQPGTILDTLTDGALRLVVDADGRYAIWWWPVTDTSYQSTPLMVGYDSSLDAAGTAELDGDANPGACGIYDYTGGAGSPIQSWDDYFTATPAVSLDSEALEFELAPMEPNVVGDTTQIATLNVAARLGSDKPNVVFEQGDGIRTMKAYKRAISKDAIMTRGYVLPSDETPWPAGALITRENAAAILARGLFEDVVSTDAGAARAAVLDLHLNFRKQARQVITFDPSATDRYTYGTDYEVGDSVTGRAKFDGEQRFNGLFRIYKVDISIDDEGTATISPTLVVD